MKNHDQVQGTIDFTTTFEDFHLLTWIEAFLIDRKATNLAQGSVKFYQKKLKYFVDFAEARAIKSVTQITPQDLRLFLLHMEETGHNPGGIHAVYRTIKAFLRWFENEVEPEGWKNPINKVKSPKVPTEPLDPVELPTVSALVNTCDTKEFTGVRDKAILLCLLDTGARAQEFLDMNLSDLNLVTGEIIIRKGKGRKPRTVYLGSKSRKAVRAYLKRRTDNEKAVWIRDDAEDRLGYDALRAIITRRAKAAKVSAPSLHDFRRAFAINMLRSGVDLVTLAKLMGHTSLAVLSRYLKQTTQDVETAHRLASPVDNGL